MSADASQTGRTDNPAEEEEAPLNVLDLPQLAHKPSYEELLNALAKFKVKPASWGSRIANKPQTEREQKASARYLTNIISSDLTWLSSDEEREKLWELGSRRLAERCGRTGAPAMTRTWKFGDDISLVIHEPPLTGDNLGLKTWASSYMLAKRLEAIGAQHKLRSFDSYDEWTPCQVLELGSGTGLVGLAAAAIWRCHVVLTDLPEILPNLRRNVMYHRGMVSKRGGWLRVKPLDWENPPEEDPQKGHYQFVIAADPLYSPSHAPVLAQVIDTYLSFDSASRVIIELPYRDKATRAMADNLRNILDQRNFELLDHGEETGYDDWEENGEIAEVRCWWGIWGRRLLSSPSAPVEDSASKSE